MSGPLDLPVRRVGPVPFRVVPFDVAVDSVLAAAASQETTGTAVHFANAYTIALADADPDYAGLFRAPNAAVFTDGMPVAWVGRRFFPEYEGSWDRVYGPDVMAAVLAASTPAGPRHYLIGGSEDTLAQLREAIAREWPEARIVGAESPPFREPTPAELAERDARVRDSGADIVWIGLGTPKQDWEVARVAGSLPVVAMAVGAAFDFLAGTKPQAPEWMRASGTEWVYRFASEPRRLAKRYLWGNPAFLRAAWRDRPRRSR